MAFAFVFLGITRAALTPIDPMLAEEISQSVVSYLEQDQLKIQNSGRENVFRTFSTSKATFSESGISFQPRNSDENFWNIRFSLTKISGVPVQIAAPNVSGNRVIYNRGNVEEIYANNKDGIQQFLKINSRETF